MILLDGKVDHVIDLVSPDETPEGEAFKLDDQHIGQTPQKQLLGGFSVLLALWTVPSNETIEYTNYCFTLSVAKRRSSTKDIAKNK